jgi:hypothetical protein
MRDRRLQRSKEPQIVDDLPAVDYSLKTGEKVHIALNLKVVRKLGAMSSSVCLTIFTSEEACSFALKLEWWLFRR